jgi:hypothetical protein
MKYYIGRSSFSFLHFMQIFPGFQPQGMLTMWDGISIPPAFTYFLVLGGGGGRGQQEISVYSCGPHHLYHPAEEK